MTIHRRLGTAAVLGALLVGCTPLGGQAGRGPLPGGRTAVAYGEVRSVDTRSARIHLREDRGGSLSVRYDGRTRVVYRQRSYPVSALERGDRVTVRLSHDWRGRATADRIDVLESIRDRGRTAARVQRVDGRVDWVDTRRGSFGISTQRGPSITVHATRDLSRADRNRLDRLRRGSRVRADVRAMGRNQYELVRFR